MKVWWDLRRLSSNESFSEMLFPPRTRDRTGGGGGNWNQSWDSQGGRVHGGSISQFLRNGSACLLKLTEKWEFLRPRGQPPEALKRRSCCKGPRGTPPHPPSCAPRPVSVCALRMVRKTTRFLFKNYLVTVSFSAVLGLPCCTQTFCGCAEWGPPSGAWCGGCSLWWLLWWHRGSRKHWLW